MKPSLMGAVKLASFVATLASLSYVISWALRNAAGVGVVRWPSAGGGGANDIKETSRSPWSSDITILETLLRDSRPADRLQAVDGGTRRRLRLLTDRATGEELLGRINAYLKRGLTLVRPRPHSRNEKLGIYDIKKSEKFVKSPILYIYIYIYIYINCLCSSVAKASYTQAVGHGFDLRPDH